jgi:hypothetical protein
MRPGMGMGNMRGAGAAMGAIGRGAGKGMMGAAAG